MFLTGHVTICAKIMLNVVISLLLLSIGNGLMLFCQCCASFEIYSGQVSSKYVTKFSKRVFSYKVGVIHLQFLMVFCTKVHYHFLVHREQITRRTLRHPFFKRLELEKSTDLGFLINAMVRCTYPGPE